MIVFKLIVQHLAIVLVTETSSKMPSTLSKIVDHFLSKSTKFCMVQTIRFCSNFTSMWSKYLSNNVWSNGNIKCPIGKSILAVNLPLELFRATVANADIRSLKSFHTFLNKMFVLYASEIWTKLYGPNYTGNFELFDKKTGFYNHFSTFKRHFCGGNYCLMPNY